MEGKEEIKVDKISVKMADTGYRSDSVSKADSSVKPVTDDFRKLLQDQEQQTDSKEVSQKDSKTEDKTEKPADKAEEKKETPKKSNPIKKLWDDEGIVGILSLVSKLWLGLHRNLISVFHLKIADIKLVTL